MSGKSYVGISEAKARKEFYKIPTFYHMYGINPGFGWVETEHKTSETPKAKDRDTKIIWRVKAWDGRGQFAIEHVVIADGLRDECRAAIFVADDPYFVRLEQSKKKEILTEGILGEIFITLRGASLNLRGTDYIWLIQGWAGGPLTFHFSIGFSHEQSFNPQLSCDNSEGIILNFQLRGELGTEFPISADQPH
jgi:hypothetical protein